eukprot:Sdes_comp16248_c0_seq1m5548
MSSDLILDTDIRDWVLVPIVVVMFLVGILRNNMRILLRSDKNPNKQQTLDGQILLRASKLRFHGGYLPAKAFYTRKSFFNHKETGILVTSAQGRVAPPNPMSDPSMMTEMMMGNMSFVLPQIVIMGWINYFFSGFLTTRV